MQIALSGMTATWVGLQISLIAPWVTNGPKLLATVICNFAIGLNILKIEVSRKVRYTAMIKKRIFRCQNNSDYPVLK